MPKYMPSADVNIFYSSQLILSLTLLFAKNGFKSFLNDFLAVECVANIHFFFQSYLLLHSAGRNKQLSTFIFESCKTACLVFHGVAAQWAAAARQLASIV